MIIALVIGVAAIFFNVMSIIGSTVNLFIPPWFNTGIQQIFGGAGWLNSILPVYPHPGYAGLAGQIGIMTIFGFILVIASMMVVVSIFYYAIRLFMGLLPWATTSVRAPHNLDK